VYAAQPGTALPSSTAVLFWHEDSLELNIYVEEGIRYIMLIVREGNS